MSYTITIEVTPTKLLIAALLLSGTIIYEIQVWRNSGSNKRVDKRDTSKGSTSAEEKTNGTKEVGISGVSTPVTTPGSPYARKKDTLLNVYSKTGKPIGLGVAVKHHFTFEKLIDKLPLPNGLPKDKTYVAVSADKTTIYGTQNNVASSIKSGSDIFIHLATKPAPLQNRKFANVITDNNNDDVVKN